MSRLSWLVVLSCSICLGVACGPDADRPVAGGPAGGDPLVEDGAHVTPTPASRCDKYCNACNASRSAADVAWCVADCNEEYRATPEEEACLDRDGGWPQLAASHGVTVDDPRYAEGLCYSLGECGDFW